MIDRSFQHYILNIYLNIHINIYINFIVYRLKMEFLNYYYNIFVNYIHYIQDYIVTSQFLLPLDEIIESNVEKD